MLVSLDSGPFEVAYKNLTGDLYFIFEIAYNKGKIEVLD